MDLSIHFKSEIRSDVEGAIARETAALQAEGEGRPLKKRIEQHMAMVNLTLQFKRDFHGPQVAAAVRERRRD